MSDLHDINNNMVTEGRIQRRWYQNHLVRTLANGLIVTLPVLILLFLLKLAFGIAFDIVAPISKLFGNGDAEPHWSINILALAILLAFFYLVGLTVRTHTGQRIFAHFEREYLSLIPLYKTVRDLVQQFTGVKELPFREVVLVDPFKSGALMTGFVVEKINPEVFTIFVPTAPNPTNGYVFHVPVKDLQFIKIPPETAMRTVVGMGTGSRTLFEKLQEEPALETFSAEEKNPGNG